MGLFFYFKIVKVSGFYIYTMIKINGFIIKRS